MSDTPASGVARGHTRTRRFQGHVAGTGEVVTVMVDEEVGGRPPKIRDPYVMLFNDGIDQIIASRLTGTDFTVLLLVLRRSRTEAFLARPGQMAVTLGIDVRRVARSLARLESLGLIRRPEHGMLELAPAIAWRGSGAKRQAALEAS